MCANCQRSRSENRTKNRMPAIARNQCPEKEKRKPRVASYRMVKKTKERGKEESGRRRCLMKVKKLMSRRKGKKRE